METTVTGELTYGKLWSIKIPASRVSISTLGGESLNRVDIFKAETRSCCETAGTIFY